ncbi:hypothetical protein [Haladaptatus sp. CMAA 1911]|uniref:hypothetical protein n=1 Tax=unclassified Haladaptatus TaxID=2622732 RepID=UPI0037549645
MSVRAFSTREGVYHSIAAGSPEGNVFRSSVVPTSDGWAVSPENAVSRREESAPSPPFSAVVLRAGL